MRRALFTVVLMMTAAIPQVARASATFSVQGPPSARPGDEAVFTVTVASDEPINAVHGVIRFDRTRVRVTAIEDAGSVIPLWLTYPVVHAGTITFDGIVPNGFGPGAGTLFDIHVSGIAVGITRIEPSEVVAYLNADTPTLATTTTRPLAVTIIQSAPASTARPATSPVVGPETDVRVADLPDTDRQLLVFSIHSSGGSVPEVLVRERPFGIGGAWVVAGNPYPLSESSPWSIIEVKLPGSDTIIFRTIPRRVYAAWLATLAGLALGAFIIRRRIRSS